ncbi:MAG: hypothetical protein KF731_10945, partial [Thauera sp.]|nr:hypothetical protein [Thauera sp.]
MGRRTFDWRRWIGGALILATSMMAGAASAPAGGDLPVAAAGGKAANLNAMLVAGFPVPPGF